MEKKTRLGSDPLSWIQDSRVVEREAPRSITPKKDSGAPERVPREITSTSRMGLRGGWTRATFIVKEEHLEKLKNIAYWDRLAIKDVINEAFAEYLRDKKVKARPQKRDL